MPPLPLKLPSRVRSSDACGPRCEQPDGKILKADGTCSAVKCAIEPVWHLPGIASRFKLQESELRQKLFEQTGGMFPELVTRTDISIFLPPIGGCARPLPNHPPLPNPPCSVGRGPKPSRAWHFSHSRAYRRTPSEATSSPTLLTRARSRRPRPSSRATAWDFSSRLPTSRAPFASRSSQLHRVHLR